MEQRITTLEEKLAHQEHTMGELNDTIYQQQLQIDRLQRALKEMEGRISSIRAEMPSQDNEPPPHY